MWECESVYDGTREPHEDQLMPVKKLEAACESRTQKAKVSSALPPDNI